MWIGVTSSSVPLPDRVLWVMLYVGPDLMLPLTSALAAIAGVLLMFWQRFVGALRSVCNLFSQRNKAPRG